MRMWNVDPKLLCQQHLLGEHVEMHMFTGTLAKGVSIAGYLERGLVNPHMIKRRHDALAAEMRRRQMNHRSPISREVWAGKRLTTVDPANSILELKRRCVGCCKRMGEQR
jgi:hypothetical protein